MTDTKDFQISILVYDPIERIFSPRLLIRQTQDGVKQDLTMQEAIDLGLTLWKNGRRITVNGTPFTRIPTDSKATRYFPTPLEAIYNFNDTGAK
jgi:hypothetical protein